MAPATFLRTVPVAVVTVRGVVVGRDTHRLGGIRRQSGDIEGAQVLVGGKLSVSVPYSQPRRLQYRADQAKRLSALRLAEARPSGSERVEFVCAPKSVQSSRV